MKMHSYMNINGNLSHINQQAQAVLAQLKKATESVGGWDEAMKTAEVEKRRAKRHTRAEMDDSPTNDVPMPGSVTPPTADVEPTKSNGDTTLRKRNVLSTLDASASSSTASLVPASQSNPSQIITTGTSIIPASSVLKPSPHLLVMHPSPEISELAREYSELESELVGMGPEYIRWPNNISLKQFAQYMIVPTLVYELEYPRTERFAFSLHIELVAYMFAH